MNSKQQNPGRNLWPVCIVTFFALAIAGCVAFVIFCNMHPTELVARDYYEQELRYQSQLDQMQRAQALPGRAEVAFDPSSRQITVAVPVTTPGRAPTGHIELYRPSAAVQDRKLPLNTSDQGKQNVDASALDPGLWRVKITWNDGAQDYYVDQKVVIAGRKS